MANVDKLIDRYIASLYNEEDQSISWFEKISTRMIYEKAYYKGVRESIDIVIELLDKLLYEDDYYIHNKEELWNLMKSQLRNYLIKLKREEQE